MADLLLWGPNLAPGPWESLFTVELDCGCWVDKENVPQRSDFVT